jgi:hypothetical protein
MRLRLKHKWRSEATYYKGERKYTPAHAHNSNFSAWIKTQATREDRRNAKELIRFELTNGGRYDG